LRRTADSGKKVSTQRRPGTQTARA
jgi:hypothetical protein